MKKPITRQVHGMADYVYAPLVFAAPNLVGFQNEKQALALCRIVGAKVLASTVVTKAEWGLFPVMPFKFHLALDVAISLFSLAAPWIFGFANNSKARNTFIAMGTVGAVVTSLTQTDEMD